MSRKNAPVVLNLYPTELAAIYAILYQVRLGERNRFEGALSDLMVDLEKNGIEDWVNEFYKTTGESRPHIVVEASDEDGLVINLVQ